MVYVTPHRLIKWFLAAELTFAASFVIGAVGAHAQEPDRNWTVYIAQAKHLDYNWCGTTTEVELRMAALVDFYLNQAERKAGRWNLDGTLWADVYHRHRGEEGLARLHRAIRDGGIGYGGNHSVLLWGILDTETAIRASYGAVPIERASGQPANTALVMENPSMTWGVANVLTSCGYDYLGRGIYSLRADSYLRNRQPYPLFWWKAPNGRRLLVHWDLYNSTTTWGGYAEAFRLMELGGARPRAQELQRLNANDTPDVFQKRKHYIEQTVARYEGYGNAYPISSILLLGTGHDGWICSDDISRFIERFNAESDGRVRLADARLRDYFEAASKEIEEKDLSVPTLEGSFGICWEEWAAHMAGLTADFREAQRLLRLAEAAEAMRAAGLADEVAFEGVRPHEQGRLIDHGFEQLLRFAEHDMGGIDRRLAAVSAGVRADAATQAIDIGRLLAPTLPKHASPPPQTARPQNLTFPWNGGQIRFDSERFAIASIVGKDGRELVPQHDGPAFGQFIHTRYKTRAQASSIFPKPLDAPSTTALRRLQCYRVPEGVHIAAEFDSSGYEVTARWFFHADQPWIDATYRLKGGWTDAPQTVQFAFPLAMENPTYRYDAPGVVLTAGPKSDGGDDLPGANPELFAGLTFASVSSGERSVILLTPNTLLLEFGPRAVRAPQYDSQNPRAQIASMPMMNLTGNDKQFGQAGRSDWTFRYRIVLARGPWDPVVPLTAAQQFGTPPFLQAPGLASCVPGLDSLAIEFPGGPVLACKTAEDDKRLIVRFWNVRNEPCNGSLELPPDFQQAEQCDALERPKGPLPVDGGRAQFTADPRAIVTIALCRE